MGDKNAESALLLKSRLSFSLVDCSNLVQLEVTSMETVRELPPPVWPREFWTTGTFLGAAKEGGLETRASRFCIMCVCERGHA